jgi:hypothetical protein
MQIKNMPSLLRSAIIGSTAALMMFSSAQAMSSNIKSNTSSTPQSLFDIGLKETKLTKKHFIKRIETPIPFYEIVYISYEVRGKYGSVPSFAIASIGKPWFYINNSMGGFDITNEKTWIKNVLPFHLDADVCREQGAVDFAPGKKYSKNDVVLIVPKNDIRVKGNKIYHHGKMYSVLIKAGGEGPFKSVKALLKHGKWEYPIEMYAVIQKSYSKSLDIPTWFRNMRYIGSVKPYKWPKKTVISRGEYSVNEKGVIARNGKPFFPITLYQYINQHETVPKTIEIFKDFKAHGISGIHCNYVTLPIAYKAGFKYNTVYWGSAGGPVRNNQIIRPKHRAPEAWKTVFAISFDNEYIRYYTKKYQQSLEFVNSKLKNKLHQQLQGNFNATAFFVNDADLFGTYTRADHSKRGYRTTKLENLECIAGSFNKCGSIIQINTGAPDARFPADVMGGIAYGGTQVMYWVASTVNDKAINDRVPDIRKLPWYDKQLPELRRYIDKMVELDLIGLQPPANFSVATPIDCRHIIKPITVGNKNYLILVNLAPESYTFNATCNGLKKGKLIDILDGSEKGTVAEKIKATVPGYFYRVVEVK